MKAKKGVLKIRIFYFLKNTNFNSLFLHYCLLDIFLFGCETTHNIIEGKYQEIGCFITNHDIVKCNKFKHHKFVRK
jgi:hypothetical protein